jgi:hypothetical protein
MLLLTGSASAIDVQQYVKQKIHNSTPSLPNPLKVIGLVSDAPPVPVSVASLAEGYVIGVPFCAASALMIDSLRKHRELKLSEAHIIVAGCFLPIIGGLIMKRLYDEHPDWDLLPTETPHYDPSIAGQ